MSASSWTKATTESFARAIGGCEGKLPFSLENSARYLSRSLRRPDRSTVAEASPLPSASSLPFTPREGPDDVVVEPQLVAALIADDLLDQRHAERQLRVGLGAEEDLKGSTLDAAFVKDAVMEALADAVPLSDLHASAEYRRRVAASLAARAVADARSHALVKQFHAH